MNNPLAGTDPSGYLVCDSADKSCKEQLEKCPFCLNTSGEGPIKAPVDNGKEITQAEPNQDVNIKNEMIKSPSESNAANQESFEGKYYYDDYGTLRSTDGGHLVIIITGSTYDSPEGNPAGFSNEDSNGNSLIGANADSDSIAGKVNDNFITPLGVGAGALQNYANHKQANWTFKNTSNYSKLADNARLIGNYSFVLGAGLTVYQTRNDLRQMRINGASTEAQVLRLADAFADIGVGALAFVLPPFGLVAAAGYFMADYFAPNNNVTELLYRSVTGRKEEEYQSSP